MNNYNNRNGVNVLMLIVVAFVLPYFWLSESVHHLLDGIRTHEREYENMPEMNSVLAKEGRVFLTTLEIGIKMSIKRIKPGESEVIAEYLKAREVEYAET